MLKMFPETFDNLKQVNYHLAKEREFFTMEKTVIKVVKDTNCRLPMYETPGAAGMGTCTPALKKMLQSRPWAGLLFPQA